MKLFFSYLNQRKKVIGLFFLFLLIHMAVFALYRLPVAATGYPVALCLVIGSIAIVLDYRKTARHHRALSAIQSMTDAITLPLPGPEGILEEDYQQIVRLMCDEMRQRAGDAGRKYQEAIDYYTVWAHQIKTPIASMRLHLQNEDSPLARQLSSDLTRIS